MNNTKFIEKLLDGVDVEWRALGSLGDLVRGNGLQKKDFTESGVPAIHYGQIYTYYGNETVQTLSFVSSETAKKLKTKVFSQTIRESVIVKEAQATQRDIFSYDMNSNVSQDYNELMQQIWKEIK